MPVADIPTYAAVSQAILAAIMSVACENQPFLQCSAKQLPAHENQRFIEPVTFHY